MSMNTIFSKVHQVSNPNLGSLKSSVAELRNYKPDVPSNFEIVKTMKVSDTSPLIAKDKMQDIFVRIPKIFGVEPPV